MVSRCQAKSSAELRDCRRPFSTGVLQFYHFCLFLQNEFIMLTREIAKTVFIVLQVAVTVALYFKLRHDPQYGT